MSMTHTTAPVGRMDAETATRQIRDLVAGRPDLARILRDQAALMSERVFGSDVTAERFLDIYLDEAWTLFRLVRPRLRPGLRILEIGGGLGLFHVLASVEGAEVISLEPSAAGFPLFRSFALTLVDAMTGRPERFVDSGIEELAWHEAPVDLVVSNNVLEHVPDPYMALRKMYGLVAAGGALLHNCPNYLIPYEPHYKVPVIPCAVQLSGKLWWRAFRHEPLWQSLNSINAVGVRRLVKQLPGARLAFHDGVGHTLARLERDGPLAARHGWLARTALFPPVRSILERVPPQLMTPMMFEITKSADPKASGVDRIG